MKALKITAFVLLMLCGLWAIFMAARPSWITPVPGVRLTPTRPILLEKDIKPDSALDLLRRASAAQQACGLTYDEQNRAEKEWTVLPWSLENASNSLVYLQTLDTCLELARRAAVAPDPQVLTVTSVSQSLHEAAGARAIARAFRMSAGIRAIKGDYTGAFSELQSTIRFSDILTRGGVLFEHLFANACSGMACKTMRQIALNYSVPDDLLREQIRFLQENEHNLEPWVECLRNEALYSRFSVEEVFRNPEAIGLNPKDPVVLIFQIGGPLLGSTPAVVTADIDACWTHLISMAEKPYDQKAYDKIEAKWDGPEWNVLLSKDPVGLMLAKIALPGMGAAHARYLNNIATLRATRIVLGVIMFKRAENRLPQTLDELVPKYLDKVPDDPFDGKPMKYRLDPDGRWVVYSIGKDQVDDGGIETDPGGRPDLIFGPTEGTAVTD